MSFAHRVALVGLASLTLLLLPARRASSTEGSCPACLEAIERSHDYWKPLFDQVLGERPMDAGLYSNLAAAARVDGGVRRFLMETLTDGNLPEGEWARLVRRSHPGLPDLARQPDARLRAFTKSLYCDRYEDYGPDDVGDVLAMADGEGGYYDTHLLMGLLLLEANGCLGAAEARQHVEVVSERILRAQRADPEYGDLFVERFAFLYWAGLGDQIEEAWTETILAHQNPDGGWGDAAGGVSNPHTTSLAMLALAYRAEGSRRQAFPYPALPERGGKVDSDAGA